MLLTREGNVFSWGCNKVGQCGIGQQNQLQIDLSVNIPKQVYISNIIAIDTGADHSAVIDGTGKVFTFGNNKYGQLGTGSFHDEFKPAMVTRITH